MNEPIKPVLDKDLSLEIRRRIRDRNRAVFIILAVLAGLFYALSVVKFKVH